MLTKTQQKNSKKSTKPMKHSAMSLNERSTIQIDNNKLPRDKGPGQVLRAINKDIIKLNILHKILIKASKISCVINNFINDKTIRAPLGIPSMRIILKESSKNSHERNNKELNNTVTNTMRPMHENNGMIFIKDSKKITFMISTKKKDRNNIKTFDTINNKNNNNRKPMSE